MNREQNFFGLLNCVFGAACVLALIAVAAFFFQRPVSDMMQLTAMNKELRKTNERLLRERNEMERLIQRLESDDRELVREARRLGYARDGEVLYYFQME